MPKEIINFSENQNECLSKIELDIDKKQITLNARDSNTAQDIFSSLQLLIHRSKNTGYDGNSLFDYRPYEITAQISNNNEVVITGDCSKALNLLAVTIQCISLEDCESLEKTISQKTSNTIVMQPTSPSTLNFFGNSQTQQPDPLSQEVIAELSAVKQNFIKLHQQNPELSIRLLNDFLQTINITPAQLLSHETQQKNNSPSPPIK